MNELEFLLEEPSMKNVLEILLPKILPKEYKLNENYFLRPHNGKSDLKLSIPKKVKAFSNPSFNKKIIILIDLDSNDCHKLKNELVELIKKNGNVHFMVRIVCKELESWYLGDMDAIEKAYPKFKARQYRKKEKFRDTDKCNAGYELYRLIPEFQKGTASRKIPLYMDINSNSNRSFNVFKKGLLKMVKPN